MSFVVVIPARYASTRLPGKALMDIGGKALIERVVDCANGSAAVRVIVATDDARIADRLANADCEVCMTRDDHQSGTDRLAEVAQKMELNNSSVVVNVQGDEPFIPARLINEVAQSLQSSKSATMSTAARRIESSEDFNNPNVVKVVIDQQGRAMYFSRSAIPHNDYSRAWHHIGIYAYRADFLKNYHRLAPSILEQAENLEQLRVMDNGKVILVQTIDYDAGIGVDTPADLERARQIATDRE
ncbi:MAG: 3-deoxy-manno-octulosonate cytidylyltransferase [Arenicella sp.]|nr:3-deoxy-manno-octulosonate cytidylyltransferase [Arenicella sp.]